MVENQRYLRVVQIQAILFLKSMSVRGGSDIERLRIWIKWSSKIDCRWGRSKFRVVLYRIRLSPTFISKITWLGYGLPLKFVLTHLKLIQRRYQQNIQNWWKFWSIHWMTQILIKQLFRCLFCVSVANPDITIKRKNWLQKIRNLFKSKVWRVRSLAAETFYNLRIFPTKVRLFCAWN